MLFRKNDESEFNEFWGLPGEDDEDVDEGRVNERTEANADQEPKEIKENTVKTEKKNKKTKGLSDDIAKAITEKTGRTEADDEISHRYTIGGYTFQTYYEYRNAEDDVRRIEVLRQELDLQDPEVAIRVYNMIREGQIVFKSPIGEEFFSHVADIVADKSVDLLEDKAVVDEAEGAAKGQKRLASLILVLAISAFIYFAYSEISDIRQTRKLSQLRSETSVSTDTAKEDKAEEKDEPSSEGSNKDTADTNAMQYDSAGNPVNSLTIRQEYTDLLSQNHDFVGWLKIPDTEIDYPVVSRVNDNDFYLNHAFDGSDDKNGTIFMDYRASITTPTCNTIIYGHDMKSGMMFGTLSNYLDESYLSDHKVIEFNTLYEDRAYEVVAVGLSQVQDNSEDGFRYYNFINAGSKADWDAFHDYVSSVNVYGETVDIEPTDQLLTLSTCNSYLADGRLFVLAKRID